MVGYSLSANDEPPISTERQTELTVGLNRRYGVSEEGLKYRRRGVYKIQIEACHDGDLPSDHTKRVGILRQFLDLLIGSITGKSDGNEKSFPQGR